MSLFTHVQRRFLNIPVYKGPFEFKKLTHKNKYPNEKFEQLYDKIKDIQNEKIEQPSPFHSVVRIKSFYDLNRTEKLICRKLGLHTRSGFEPQIIPNTPHFNRLLWEVKHLIQLRPISFPDGLPKEEDIGFIHFNHFTGVMNIDSKYKKTDFQLNGYKNNPIYEGTYLREYLKKLSGILAMTTRN